MYLPPSLSIFMAAEGKVGGEKAPSGGASAAQKNWTMVPVNAICPIQSWDLKIHSSCTILHNAAPCCTRVCQSMPEYARVCKSMPEYARVCQSMPEYARVCQSMPEYAKVCQS